MNLLKNSIRSFKAEWIKLKHSGIFWLIVGMSAFIPLIFTLITIFANERSPQAETNPWEDFLTTCYRGFAGFFFPIFLVLVASRLAQIENKSGGWKLIETQPMHRSYLFLAKWEVAMLLSLFCLLSVLFFGLIGAGVVTFTDAGEPFKKSRLDIWPILALVTRLWISSLGILAIQYFLSLWVANFFFSFGVGLVAIIAASILAGLNAVPWFPYSATIFTIRNAKGSQTGSFLLHHEWLSIVWMFLFLWIGYQWYYFKSWKFAFLRPGFKPFLWIGVILLFALAFWFIEKPVQLNRYGKTVIAGKIAASDTVDHVVVLKSATFDTLLVIPVQQNRFHYSGNIDLPLSEYIIAAGPHRVIVIFSGNDSIHVDWKWSKSRESSKIGGTRVAENEHYSSRNNSRGMEDYFLNNFPHDFTPARYASEVTRSYASAKKSLEKFRTVDNLKPSEDYRSLIEKLTTFRYLRMLDIDYPAVFAVYNPNDSLKYPESVEQFRKKGNITDSSLVNFSEFRDYLMAYYHLKSGIPEKRKDSAFFNFVLRNTPAGKTRDMLLYEEMKTVLSYVRDSSRRNNFIASYTPSITDQKLKTSILNANARLNRVGRGSPAPDIQAVALNDKMISLKDLEGRYVVIDVWASWCAPCIKEAPYFEELAENYTSEILAFVSLSVDQNQNAWKIASRDKSKRVLQLWATNAREFSNYLAIEYIPRFILIDPKGRIVDVQLPFPSDPAFEEILQKEISQL